MKQRRTQIWKIMKVPQPKVIKLAKKKKKKSRNKFMCQEPIGSTKSKNKT